MYSYALFLQVVTASMLLASADGRGTHVTQTTTDASWTAPPNSFADAPIHTHDWNSGAPPMQAGSSSSSPSPSQSTVPTFQTLRNPVFYRPLPLPPPSPFIVGPPLICPPRYYPPSPRDVGQEGVAPASEFYRHGIHPAAAAAAGSTSRFYYRDTRFPYFPFPLPFHLPFPLPFPYSIRCYPFPLRRGRPLPGPIPRKRAPPVSWHTHVNGPAAAPAQAAAIPSIVNLT